MRPAYQIATPTEIGPRGFDRPSRKGQAIAGLQARPAKRDQTGWIERGEMRTSAASVLRGHGVDHHGLLGIGVLTDAGIDRCPVPIQDDWDF